MILRYVLPNGEFAPEGFVFPKLNTLKHLQMPADSVLCGQYCIAMIGGISVEESIRLCGTSGRANWGTIKFTLKRMGQYCSRWRVGFPTVAHFWHGRGVMRLRANIEVDRYIVWDHGVFYDPLLPAETRELPEQRCMSYFPSI